MRTAIRITVYVLFTAACIAAGIAVASAIGNSNLPDWLKLYLLTH